MIERPWQGRAAEEYYSSHATTEELAMVLGGSNWLVTTRRTGSIVRRYGDDVIVIAPEKYERLSHEALLRRTEGFD
jgi:hypothetical protein